MEFNETQYGTFIWHALPGKMVKFGPPDGPAGKTGNFSGDFFFMFFHVLDHLESILKKIFNQNFFTKKNLEKFKN